MPAQAGQSGVRVPCGSEGGDGLSVGVENSGACSGEDGESRAAVGAEPRSEGDGAVVGAMEEDDPASRVGESVEVCGDFAERVAPAGGVELCDDEKSGVVAVCDTRDAEGAGWVWKAECGDGARVELVSGGGEAECAGERQSTRVGVGGCEQAVCGARGEHGATVASRC